MSTLCKELIVTTLATRGTGKGPESPVRMLTRVYEKDGKLIAENDPCGGFAIEDLLEFSDFVVQGKGSIREWLEGRKCTGQRSFRLS